MKILNDFRTKVRFPLSWGDMDAMQHINNVVFLKYFENSRIKYYDEIGLSCSANSKDYIGVVKSISCEYLLPLVYPDNVEAGVRVTAISDNSFTMEHYICSESKGLCAFGETEIAVLDGNSLKPVTIPDKIRLEIEKIEQRKF
jgi:acyl-CoA thioester hydrolase